MLIPRQFIKNHKKFNFVLFLFSALVFLSLFIYYGFRAK